MRDRAAAVQRAAIASLLLICVIVLIIISLQLSRLKGEASGGSQQCQSQSRTAFYDGGAETTTVTECRSVSH